MKKTCYSILRINQLGACAADALKYVVESGIEGLPDDKRVETVRMCRGAMVAAMRKERRNFYVQDLQVAEKSVAMALAGIKGCIRELMSWEESPEDIRLAEKMLAGIKALGLNWYKQKRGDQTTNLEQMIVLLRGEEYTAVVEKSNMGRWLDKVEDACSVFNNVRLKKIENNRVIQGQPSASSLKKPLQEAMGALYDYVQSMAVATEVEAWNTLFLQLHENSIYHQGTEVRKELEEIGVSGEGTASAMSVSGQSTDAGANLQVVAAS